MVKVKYINDVKMEVQTRFLGRVASETVLFERWDKIPYEGDDVEILVEEIAPNHYVPLGKVVALKPLENYTGFEWQTAMLTFKKDENIQCRCVCWKIPE